MPRGRTYELKAVFTAENKAGRTIAALERRLESLQNKVDKLSKTDATVGIGEKGAAQTGARVDDLANKVRRFDKMEAEADVGINDKKLKQSKTSLADLDSRIKKLTSRPNVVDIEGNSKDVERTIRDVAKEARELASKAYTMELRAEARGFTQVQSQAAELKRTANEVNNSRMQLIAELKGVPQVLRDAGLIKVALNSVDGTYSIKFNTSGLTSAVTTTKALGAAISGYGRFLSRAAPLTQAFAQKVYIAQQAMSVFRLAIMAVAIASAGPLVAGLTILGSSLVALAGGFGLVAMAAAPIISHFANAQERAQQLETAQNELSSAQETAASSAQAVADAQRGVGDAYRSGQEAIQSAIQAHADAVRGVEEAQRSYQDSVRAVGDAERQAHEGVRSAIDAHRNSIVAVQDAQRSYVDAQESAAQATEDVAMATREYNTALATEQFRLRSMQLDIQGMRLSQKQLAFDMRGARRELEQAENPRERKEAQLRLQQLELQRKQNMLDMGQAQRELNEAQKKGTDELQSAADARQQALEAQKDAQQGVVDALREVASAQKEEAKAQREITMARKEGNRQIRDAQRAAQDAQRAVQDAMRTERRAQKEIGKARSDAARQMADANRALAQANKAMADAQADVKDKQSALNALLGKTPKHLQKIQQAVNRFKEQYNTSFEAAQLSTSRLATRLINVGTRTLPMLGEAANKSAQGLNKALSNISRNFRDLGVIRNFQTILASMPNITKNWTQAIGNFGGAFVNIMGQAMPFARRLAQAVKDTSRNFLAWTDSDKGRAQLKRFFQSAAPVAQELWHQIRRIGGALLHWSTQSKKGPQQIARAINTIGDVVMSTAKFIAFMIRLWNKLPRPIQKVLVATLLVHGAMRVLVGSRMIAGIARVGFGIGRWVYRMVAAKVATSALGKSIVLAGGKWAFMKQQALRASIFIWSQMARLGAFLTAMWGKVMARMVTVSAMGARGILMSFGPIGLAIGAIGWYLVNVFKRAYTSITKTTPIVANNLVKMHQQGAISSGEKWIAAFRFAAAETYKVMVGAFRDMQKTIIGILGAIPGMDGVVSRWKSDIDKGLNDTYKAIAGKTALMAKNMDNNTDRGGDSMKENVKASGNAMEKSMGGTQKAIKIDLEAMKTSMNKQTKEGGKKGTENLWDFNRGGTNAGQNLYKNMDGSMGDLNKGIKGYTDDTKTKGIKDFWDFNRGGIKASDDLNMKSVKAMGLMQGGVNKASDTTKVKTIADLVDMQERGTGEMAIAQEKWVSSAWNTSSQTQEAFNAILEGLGRFIEKADIDMKKPEQFSVVYRKGHHIAGNGNENPIKGGYGLAKGGVMNYAAGGQHGPVGGVAEGTTRVYGEVPGTTEFYITDNKKYRDRNMDILAAANQHMMKMAGGGQVVHDERTGRYAPEEIAMVKTQGWDLIGGDKKLGLRGPAAGTARRMGKKQWGSTLPLVGGRDANVSFREGGGSGRTSSGGSISVDPKFRRSPLLEPIFVHELGHAAGLGHSNSGIMTPVVNQGSHTSSAERRWMHNQYGKYVGKGSGSSSDGGGGDIHVGPDGETKQEKRQEKRQDKRERKQERRAARKDARKFRNRFNRKKSNFGPLGERGDYSMNAAWMARGGTHKPAGMTRSQGRFMLDIADERASALHDFATGGIYSSTGVRVRSGELRNLGGTTYNWDEPAKSIQADTKKNVGGISTNTYINHPGGESNSVDHWAPGGRGSPIGSNKGNQVEDYILANHKKAMEYYIWQGTIHGWGGSKPYSDKSDQHFDHLHATYPGGSPNLGGAAGGSSGPSAEEINKWFEDSVPTMPNNLGYGLLGQAASMLGSKARESAKEHYIAKVPTGSGGALPDGSSPKGLTIGEALSQSGWPDNQLVQGSSTIWHESRGNAKAQNPSGARGLMQIMPQTAKGVGADYGKLYDPLYNTATGLKVFKEAGGWGPWVGAGQGGDYRNKPVTGYSNGGVVTRPHLGMIGDKGPEVNLPLDDPRALNMMRRAFDTSDRVKGGSIVRSTGDAVNSRFNVDSSTGSTKDNFITQHLDNKRDVREMGDKIERAVDKMRKEIVQELRKEMNLSDDSAAKFMEAGGRMMLKMLQHPHIGGNIVDGHIERIVEFENELTKK